MDAETYRLLGELAGKVDGLIRQGDQARESREKTYQRLEAVGTALTQLLARVEHVEGAVQEMEPLVAEFGRLRQQGRGMLLVLGLIWLLLGGLVVQALGWAAGWLIRAVNGGP